MKCSLTSAVSPGLYSGCSEGYNAMGCNLSKHDSLLHRTDSFYIVVRPLGFNLTIHSLVLTGWFDVFDGIILLQEWQVHIPAVSDEHNASHEYNHW